MMVTPKPWDYTLLLAGHEETPRAGLPTALCEEIVSLIMQSHISVQKTNAFTVLPQRPISYHNQITLYLKKRETDRPIPLLTSFYHSQNTTNGQKGLADYTKVFNNTNIQNMLDNFVCNPYQINKESINLDTKDLNHIFMKLARVQNEEIKQKNKQKNNVPFSKSLENHQPKKAKYTDNELVKINRQ